VIVHVVLRSGAVIKLKKIFWRPLLNCNSGGSNWNFRTTGGWGIGILKT
jgi:hypothetical protein